MDSQEQARLNTPSGRRRWGPRHRGDGDAFGRFAEGVARYMGTANFVMWMTVFVIVWVTANVVLVKAYRWDPYPFILLNLMLSFQAAFTAPIIMMSQNRQTSRDRIASELDFEVNRIAAKEVDEIQSRLDELMTEQMVTLLESINEYRTILNELYDRTDRIEKLIRDSATDESVL